MSISLFVKKKKILRLFLSLLKKKKLNVLDSWHIYCFIVQVTFMFILFFVYRTHEWCCINIGTRHVHTNTYWSWWLKIALYSLLFGWVVLMMTLGFVSFYFDNNLTYSYIHFWLLDTSRQWPTYRYGLLFWALTMAYT